MKHNFGKKIMDFIEQKKWRDIKKGDWLIIVLVGVLLLILAMPVERKEERSSETGGEVSEEVAAAAESTGEDYAEELERRLEKVLQKIAGVGEVKVMITLSDFGEDVLEKDCVTGSSTTTETDAGGGSRTITQSDISNTTVYVERDGSSVPYLQKELTPEVEGIVVVAEGGDNQRVISDISDAVMALFPVEAHKVKVVKMSMQEDVK